MVNRLPHHLSPFSSLAFLPFPYSESQPRITSHPFSSPFSSLLHGARPCCMVQREPLPELVHVYQVNITIPRIPCCSESQPRIHALVEELGGAPHAERPHHADIDTVAAMVYERVLRERGAKVGAGGCAAGGPGGAGRGGSGDGVLWPPPGPCCKKYRCTIGPAQLLAPSPLLPTPQGADDVLCPRERAQLEVRLLEEVAERCAAEQVARFAEMAARGELGGAKAGKKEQEKQKQHSH